MTRKWLTISILAVCAMATGCGLVLKLTYTPPMTVGVELDFPAAKTMPAATGVTK